MKHYLLFARKRSSCKIAIAFTTKRHASKKLYNVNAILGFDVSNMRSTSMNHDPLQSLRQGNNRQLLHYS